jgi:hypothetical protein
VSLLATKTVGSNARQTQADSEGSDVHCHDSRQSVGYPLLVAEAVKNALLSVLTPC